MSLTMNCKKKSTMSRISQGRLRFRGVTGGYEAGGSVVGGNKRVFCDTSKRSPSRSPPDNMFGIGREPLDEKTMQLYNEARGWLDDTAPTASTNCMSPQ